MAGASFDVVEQLGTPKTSAAARDLIVRQKDYETARIEVERELAAQRKKLNKDDFRAWKKTMSSQAGTFPDGSRGVHARCLESGATLANAQTWFDETLQYELKAARVALLAAARGIVSRYLVFSDPDMRNRLNAQSAQQSPFPRNKQ